MKLWTLPSPSIMTPGRWRRRRRPRGWMRPGFAWHRAACCCFECCAVGSALKLTFAGVNAGMCGCSWGFITGDESTSGTMEADGVYIIPQFFDCLYQDTETWAGVNIDHYSSTDGSCTTLAYQIPYTSFDIQVVINNSGDCQIQAVSMGGFNGTYGRGLGVFNWSGLASIGDTVPNQNVCAVTGAIGALSSTGTCKVEAA